MTNFRTRCIVGCFGLECGIGFSTDILLVSHASNSGLSVVERVYAKSLEFPRGGTVGAKTIQVWWGNTVYKNTADFNMAAFRQVPNGSTFG